MLNRLNLISKNPIRFFQIAVSVIIGLILLFVGLSRLFNKPDFRLFDKTIYRIDFVTLVKVNDILMERTISITEPELIKVFCEDIKCCSKIKNFENNRTNGWYHVNIHSQEKVFQMQMGFTSKGNFIMLVLDNFEGKGNVRKYSNLKIREFLENNIKSKLYY
jgi:hypothetical protein